MEIPQSLIDAKAALERAAIRLANAACLAQEILAVVSRGLTHWRILEERGQSSGSKIPQSVIDAIAALDRAAKLADAASLPPETLSLVSRALAELRAEEHRRSPAIGSAAAPAAMSPAPTITAPSSKAFHQQPYQPPPAVRERAGR